MFSTLFLKPFLILEIFFQKNLFLTPLTPLFIGKNPGEMELRGNLGEKTRGPKNNPQKKTEA